MEPLPARDWNKQPPTTRAEAKQAIAQMLAEMDQMNERMAENQTEIDRLGVETRAILDNLARMHEEDVVRRLRETAIQDEELRLLREENQRLRSEHHLDTENWLAGSCYAVSTTSPNSTS